MNYSDVLYTLVGFTLVAIIFLVILGITLKILSKNFSIDKIKLYGIFLNMDDKTILSFSLVSINYLFLVWCLINFDINYIYLIFSLILVILSDILVKNFSKIIINIVTVLSQCGAIYIVSLLNDYIFTEYYNVLLLVVLVFIVIFIFLYFTYMLFRQLNGIIKVEKRKRVKK